MHNLLLILLWPFRLISGLLILALDRLPVGRGVSRTPEQQARVDEQTRGWVLYHMEACPFCVKVRRHVRKLGLTIPMRDIKRDPHAADELVVGGGKDQVPCLWLPADSGTPGASARWMYESGDINAFLSERFGR